MKAKKCLGRFLWCDYLFCFVEVNNLGTWQKRGFTSLNGAVADLSIDTGHVIDIDVMSRYCLPCMFNKSRRICTENGAIRSHTYF